MVPEIFLSDAIKKWIVTISLSKTFFWSTFTQNNTKNSTHHWLILHDLRFFRSTIHSLIQIERFFFYPITAVGGIKSVYELVELGEFMFHVLESLSGNYMA